MPTFLLVDMHLIGWVLTISFLTLQSVAPFSRNGRVEGLGEFYEMFATYYSSIPLFRIFGTIIFLEAFFIMPPWSKEFHLGEGGGRWHYPIPPMPFSHNTLHFVPLFIQT
jgi:hypothetical protein